MVPPLFSGKKAALQSWQDFRATLLETDTDLKQLEKTANWWSTAPLSKRVIDWDTPENWPDPWQLIYNGNFDESCVTLGIFYTLLYSPDKRWDSDRLKVILAIDHSRQIQQLILDVDTRWLLNLEYNSIVDRKIKNQAITIQTRYALNDQNKFYIVD